MAVQFGHEVVLRALIEADADINKATNDGSTPLIKAAEKGHKAVVRALIEADVDVNKAKDDGGTALGIAA
jgi:ankyrin repeat protein